MPEYLISFNDTWVGEWTEEELHAKTLVLRPLIAEMKERGVLIFTGGLDSGPLFNVTPDGETPVFTDGPYVETKEHIGGFAVIDVADEDAARHWAGQIAVACGWPQEVYEFMPHHEVAED